MNFRPKALFCIALIAGSGHAWQEGKFTLTNSLAQPIFYHTRSEISGQIGGSSFAPGAIFAQGRGTIGAQATTEIGSSLLMGGKSIWGDTIELKIGRTQTSLQPFTIQRLGITYTIAVDSQNNLTLNPS